MSAQPKPTAVPVHHDNDDEVSLDLSEHGDEPTKHEADAITDKFIQGSASLQDFIHGILAKLMTTENNLRVANDRVNTLQAEVANLNKKLDDEKKKSNNASFTAVKNNFINLQSEFEEEKNRNEEIRAYAADAHPRNAKLAQDRADQSKKLSKLTDDVRVLLDRTKAWVDRVAGIETYHEQMKDDIDRLQAMV